MNISIFTFNSENMKSIILVWFRPFLFLLLFLSCQNQDHSVPEKDQDSPHYVPNRFPLIKKMYLDLPLGSIQPRGWLLEQLKRMKTGLTGHLDEIYPEVVGPRNGWLGGDGDGWERGPYWIDGLLPLAYILNDDSLKAKIKPWIEWSLSHQNENGFFGPVPFDQEPPDEPGLQKTRRRDWWPKMVMLKVLQQHFQATGDERVIKLMTKYFQYQLKTLPEKPLDHWSLWANRRGGDNLMVVYWLYNLTGDSFLLELAELIHQQTFPWTRVFQNEISMGEIPTPWFYSKIKPYPFDEKEIQKLSLSRHGTFHTVNLAQGIKEPLIYFQQHPDSLYYLAVKKAFKTIKEYHGQPQGMYGGDEPLHGNDPTRGVELCSVVELMYSLENMLTITGDVEFADHLEKLAFNALPAQVTDDFMYRQYFQSANQVTLQRGGQNFFEDVGHEGTDVCFGTLTGFPCCTCNMHQGWPKFTNQLWHATLDRGLAALTYAASEVTAKVGNGEDVRITEETYYPFEETISFTIHTDKPVEFPFHLRIPGWCKKAVVKVNGETIMEKAGGQISVIKRTWYPDDVLTLTLPMRISVSQWFEFSKTIERGPLVYSSKIEEDWKWVKNEDRFKDFLEVSPKSPWNFALIEDHILDPEQGFKFKETGKKSMYPWNLDNAPVSLQTEGILLPHWKLHDRLPSPLPWSTRSLKKDFTKQSLTLSPYGCTTLRITEFPVVRLPD